ncbi:hypothetical protein [Roseovarius ramblicola]|uniref:YdhG-like domain-containing protein n=1 Tax=Roseovarius ramblicola TaxID=2022336 RepID=A0ABV5I2N6_9RHOB
MTGDLISELDMRRGLTDTGRQCLRVLRDETSVLPFDLKIQKRGHFGDVLRWTCNGKLWFDALPAKQWVLFYLNKRALSEPGLSYSSVSARLPHAVERRDLIVNVRLHDKSEASTMAALIRDAARFLSSPV